MSRFIELTEVGYQRKVTVNVDRIVVVQGGPRGTRLTFPDGGWVTVTEEYHEVRAMLEPPIVPLIRMV